MLKKLPPISRRDMKYTMWSVTSTAAPRKKGPSGKVLSDVLRDDEVVTSATLLDRLEADGMSRNAARQVLWRTANSADVWRSEELLLEGGARLFCKRSTWGGPDFHNGVAAILSAQRPGFLQHAAADLRDLRRLSFTLCFRSDFQTARF